MGVLHGNMSRVSTSNNNDASQTASPTTGSPTSGGTVLYTSFATIVTSENGVLTTVRFPPKVPVAMLSEHYIKDFLSHCNPQRRIRSFGRLFDEFRSYSRCGGGRGRLHWHWCWPLLLLPMAPKAQGIAHAPSATNPKICPSCERRQL